MTKQTKQTSKASKKELLNETSVEIGKRLIGEAEDKEKRRREEEYSTADRLMMQVKHQVIPVKIRDNILGDFTIKCRPFTWSEHQKLVDARNDVGKLERRLKDNSEGAGEALKKAMHQFFSLLAYPDGICLDSSLTLDFWLSGNYDQSVPTTIFSEVSRVAQKQSMQARSFRNK